MSETITITENVTINITENFQPYPGSGSNGGSPSPVPSNFGNFSGVNILAGGSLAFNEKNILRVGAISPDTQSHVLFIGLNAGLNFPIASTADEFGVVAVGCSALQSLTALGTENTAVGAFSCQYLQTGQLDTAYGMHSLGACTAVDGIVALGNDAMRDSFPAGYDIAIGQHALAHGITTNASIAIGSQALRGCSAAVVFSGTPTTGDVLHVTLSSANPTLVGVPQTFNYTVLAGNTLLQIATAMAVLINGAITGPNYFVGTQANIMPDGSAALSMNYPGNNSVGWAITVTTTKSGGATTVMTVVNGSSSNNNIAIGTNAMEGFALGSSAQDTVLGNLAGQYITTASLCTLIGFQAGAFIMDGDKNTILGANAGKNIVHGNSNTIMGFNAAVNLTGNSNTIIGQSVASNTLTTGAANIYIGVSGAIDAAASGESHVFRLGDNSTNLMRATGINTASPAFFLDWFPASTTYANDSAASAGGVAVGQIYRNGSVMQVRIT